MKIIIGITGGIASGKSTLTNMIKSDGIKVIDADALAHHIYEIPSVCEEVRQIFPSAFVNNQIDRSILGKIVFSDSTKLNALNTITHRVIFEEIKKEIDKSTDDYVVLDVPLLFEAKFDVLCDYTILVYTSIDKQIERIVKRDNLTIKEAKQRISSQMSLDEKLKLADFSIDNSTTITNLKNKFDNILKGIMNNAKNI